MNRNPTQLATPIWQRLLAQKVDELTSKNHGITSLGLMDAAGKACATLVQRLADPSRPILALCGAGNNGGDALVAARILHAARFSVTAVLVLDHPGQKCSASCQKQLEALKELGLPVQNYGEGLLRQLKLANPLILDGLLGLGFHGELREGAVKQALAEAAALSQKTVVAIDLPSGLGSDFWQQEKVILPADHTITFGALKPALALSPARSLCGSVSVAKIGFPAEAIAEAMKTLPALYSQANPKAVMQVDPFAHLSRDAHKFERGHVLVVGGSPGKTGAAALAALAAYRAGAGWVSLALAEAAAAKLPVEVTQENFFKGGEVDAEGFENFLGDRKVKAVVLGPGTVKSGMTAKLLEVLQRAIQKLGLFIVIDAGFLHKLGALLAKNPLDANKVVLTPHPGEWRKLHDGELEAGEDFATVARQKLACWQVSAIYKSATPLILSPDWQELVFLNDGPSALAKAGSGDVLAGVIAAYGAQGLPAPLAALRAQAAVHEAARKLIKLQNENSVIASDLVEALKLI